ncbi:LTA synthase family protein [Chitinophaga rhizosphaerae]|uniref:LTA synthase family protein n=1 Tax=Chitinophaga rhizosphaerae TaxID=1864947 RepID=UPI0013E05AFD|nr:LTA synthase family protein [Chitinophaga rhizosphaerae]
MSLLLFLLILVLRAIDLFMIGTFPVPLQTIIGRALWADVLTFLSVIRWIVLPFLLLYMLVSPRAGNAFYISLIVLYVIVSFSLNLYFHQTSVPLGADLFGYNMHDIKQTVGAAAGSVPTATLTGLGVAVAVSAVAIVLFVRGRIRGDRRGFWFVLACILLFWIPVSRSLTRSGLRSEYAGNIVLNKTGFFLAKSADYFFPGDAAYGVAGEDLKGDPLFTNKYLKPDAFPFLHAQPAGNNLQPYFRADSVKPNVVIILVEGLGRAFSGNNAYLGSFTPFLDSLGRRSLYFENMLSGGGRTFAVLPTMLGSLPFGKNGFAEMAPGLPNSLTLMNLARHNGYGARFLYAGDASFDKMDLFVRNQGVDSIIDKSSFGDGYHLLPANSGGFTWGYGDDELFRKYFDATPDSGAPRLDVMLTVSTHSPFKIPDQAHYNALAEQRIKSLKLTAEETAAHMQYLNVYASVMYMDASIRGFFRQLQSRKDYANTIVLITGDHRLPEIPMRSKIDRYHTLLLVHSPLLNQHTRFSSVSSHFDVAPSFTRLLAGQYGWDIPQEATWVGTGLDTTRAFRNVHHYPLMQTKNDLADYVAGPYFMNSGSLYRILPNLDLEPEDDEDTAGKLEAGFAAYRKRNDRMVQTRQLLPDSLYSRYVRK